MTVPRDQLMEKVVALTKRRGFIFPSSEIYGGLSGFYDYGPYGVALKRAIRDLWWRHMVDLRDDVVGLESTLIMPSRGVGRLRPPDQLRRPAAPVPRRVQEALARRPREGRQVPRVRRPARRGAHVQPDVQDPRRPGRGLLLRGLPATRDRAGHVRRLQERAQLVARARALRHRAAGQGVPQRDHARQLRLPRARVRADGDGVLRQAGRRTTSGSTTGARSGCAGTRTSWASTPSGCACTTTRRPSLSHYSKQTTDIEYEFPFGWGELEGIADRTDFDLRVHQEQSKVDLTYLDPETNERYLPWVIEPAVSVDRIFITLLLDAYDEDVVNNEPRVVLHLHPNVAPVQVAVVPLSKKEELIKVAREVQSVAAGQVPGRVRPDGRQHRPALPPPGRDRHPVLRHGRLRDAERPGGDDPPARHHRAGTRRDRRAHRPPDGAGRLEARPEPPPRDSAIQVAQIRVKLRAAERAHWRTA